MVDLYCICEFSAPSTLYNRMLEPFLSPDHEYHLLQGFEYGLFSKNFQMQQFGYAIEIPREGCSGNFLL